MMGKKLKSGDVLEITTSDGVIYAHYLGKHQVFGDAVAICATKQLGRVPLCQELFQGSYVTFYPASHAVRHGLAAVVGNLPSPGIPNCLRRPGARSNRKVETWIIEDDSGQ